MGAGGGLTGRGLPLPMFLFTGQAIHDKAFVTQEIM
jgi:hypothetical protein